MIFSIVASVLFKLLKRPFVIAAEKGRSRSRVEVSECELGDLIHRRLYQFRLFRLTVILITQNLVSLFVVLELVIDVTCQRVSLMNLAVQGVGPGQREVDQFVSFLIFVLHAVEALIWMAVLVLLRS